MKQIWAIFLRDIKNIGKNPVAVIVALGIMILPSLYAWFNIAANWDPYGNTKGLRVAVTSLDQGTRIEQLDTTVNIGDMIISNLHENDQIGWQFVDEEQAVEGVKAGRYYACVIIPEDFSEKTASIFTSNVQKPTLQYYVNEKKNAIATKITDKGVSTIQQQVNESLISASSEALGKAFHVTYGTVEGKKEDRSLTYAEFNPGEEEAEWVPEGGLKPMMSGTLAEVTINAGKVALGTKVTEETLSDLPQLVAEVRAEIINRIGLKEEEGILSGTGSGGQIKGIGSDIPTFSLTALKVEKPNTYDVIVGMYTQIVSMSNMAYRPNLVLMHPLDYAQMQLTKDVNGQYLRPFRIGDELIQGLKVETSTAIKQGDIWVGDFNYLNIRDVWVLTITLGWENDDFTKNMVTILGEKRLMVYIKKQYKTAFVKDKIATVIEAITPAGIGG